MFVFSCERMYNRINVFDVPEIVAQPWLKERKSKGGMNENDV